MTPDPWDHLKRLTSARIALGRCGGSLPTRELLDFSLAHARARDAVFAPFDSEKLAREIGVLGLETCELSSAARSRDEYLQFPDRGRALCGESRRQIAGLVSAPADLAVVVADGLSPLAAHVQAVPVLQALVPRLTDDGWTFAPVSVVRFGRVAIADEIGQAFRATLALILLGERPGLGSPDSLGAYFVYHPAPGRTDAERNCVSNIRPAGLPPAAAAATLQYLLTESRRRKLSGVALKDEQGGLAGSAHRIGEEGRNASK